VRRLVSKSFVVVAASALATLVFAGTASAGDVVTPNHLTIVKIVDGTPPAGTTFTVTVSCDNNVIAGPTNTATVSFDSDGQPTTPDTINLLSALGTCTVTETVKGGATSTTYECEGGGVSPSAAAVAPVCPQAGPITAPITVNKSFPSIDATVTVTNTFVAQPPPVVEQPQVAPKVVAQPAFTG
jgi:hypothetical protein